MSDAEGILHEDHFQSLERQKKAVRLGMWIFLTSEALLFAALFGLYASYRAQHTDAFEEGVRHNLALWGTAMTATLLISSLLVAWAVHVAREDQPRRAAQLVSVTIVLGFGFMAMKLYEYADHVQHGIVPGGGTRFFEQGRPEGMLTFFNLYYTLTGLHLLHVTAGIVILSFVLIGLIRGRIRAPTSHRVELGALYWHLVDAIWVFLWPMFYLMGRTGG